jgi:uncharacterized protein (DUF302 family)
MNSADLAYKKTSTKPFAELISNIEEEATKRNFRVLHIHDVQATLAEKGLELTPYSIVEVCNGGFAQKVLNAEKEIGMMLPCRIAVYDDNGTNTVLLMKPSLISVLMPGADIGSIPQDVEKILIEVVDEAIK